MPTAKSSTARAAAFALALSLSLGANAQEPLDEAIEARVEAQDAEAATQQTIDSLATDTEAMVSEYRQATAQRDALAAYNVQLARLVESQETELAGFADQMATAEASRTELVPLLGRMVETLERFVALDLPFLTEERQRRLDTLKTMLDDAAVSVPEKYRRVMEAYQVETEYGRTIETYRGDLATGAGNRAVEFLRVGRVALLYATLDGSETGWWDAGTRAWKPLPREYDDEVLAGIKVARKETPPDLIQVPLPAPKPAQPAASPAP